MAKDPNAPKKPATAYFLFMSDLRLRMKEEDNEIVKDVARFGKYAGDQWKELADDKKKKWTDKYAELMEEYNEKMKNYTPSEEYRMLDQQRQNFSDFHALNFFQHFLSCHRENCKNKRKSC